jgi:hypothetical protein
MVARKGINVVEPSGRRYCYMVMEPSGYETGDGKD